MCSTSNNQSVNAGISSSVTLFNGLQNVATLHEAEKNQDASTLDLTRAKQTTVFTVASNYLSIITAQEQLKVQQQNLALARRRRKTRSRRWSTRARARSRISTRSRRAPPRRVSRS